MTFKKTDGSKILKIMISIRYILFFIFGIALNVAFGQNNQGVIHYEKEVKWIKIMATLSFMTQEDIDRSKLTWGKSDGLKEKYVLFYDEKKMTYYDSPEEVEEFSWSNDLYYLEHTFKENQINNNIDLLGKKYIVEGDAEKHKWKILNEIKEIAGYLCMKAETFDEANNRKVIAWFADGIPISGGPEGYYGLPGMILELNFGNGCSVITATKVDYSSTLKLDKRKRKGKRVTQSEINKKIKKYYESQIKEKRNPYWQMRY